VIFDISQPYRFSRPVPRIALLLFQRGERRKIKKRDKRKNGRRRRDKSV
jgi:hypothetical protein